MRIPESKPLKIYTLSIPPTPEEPFLQPGRHQRILRKFQKGQNACHTLNSLGEVDFYLLLPPEEDFEDYPAKSEEFGLQVINDHKLKLEIYYDEELFGEFLFDLQNPLDVYCLRYLTVHKRTNIYFIQNVDDLYVCYGYKSIILPGVLSYDLARKLAGQKPLVLPGFSSEYYSDEFFTRDMLLGKAWGFYLDYTALQGKMENREDAEEIISLHILHGLARLQKSRSKAVKEDRYILWIGRRIGLDAAKQPKEYYSVYLSGGGMKGTKTRDHAARLFEEALQELPEYQGSQWVTPLAEEAVPLVVIARQKLYRLNMAEHFYALSRSLFAENFAPRPDYQSYYDRIYQLRAEKSDSKIYNLWLKRWEQGYDENGRLPVSEIEKLIEDGQEEDLTRIFMLLASVPERELDNLIVRLCEKYRQKAEPYLLAGLQSSLPHLQGAALLGLGIIESGRAIPGLMRLVRQGQELPTVWDTFLMIGEPAVPALTDLLQEPDLRVRQKALETLKFIQGAPGVEEPH